MKVVLTADAVGGIWTYALDLGRALTARGVTVTLAVLGPEPDEPLRESALQAGLDVADLGHPPEWLASGPDQVERGADALKTVLRERGADILHLNHPALGAFGSFARPTLAVCHSCVATWWAAVESTPLPADLIWQADLVGKGYRAASVLVAPSRAFAAATRTTYDLPRLPRVIPNGRTAPPAPGTRDPAPSALTIGRLWDAGKGVSTLDRAAARTIVPIEAAGPTRGPNGAAIALSGLRPLGALAEGEVRRRLGERPVVVSAAFYEPFGLAVLEAAQAGCALVLSDIPTFRELWDEAALFVRPGDAAGFAAAIDRLVGAPSLRSEIAAAARDRSTRYTLDLQADALMDVYRALRGHTGSHAA